MKTQTQITLSAPAKSGYQATFGSAAEAQQQAARLLDCTVDEMVLVESPDGGTTYYYASQAEADADSDGAFAVQSTEDR